MLIFLIGSIQSKPKIRMFGALWWVFKEPSQIKKPTNISACGLPLPLLDLNQRPSD